MSKITKIYARQVLDSRGNPTVEAEVTTEAGNVSRGIVPSGASTGSREALELRDGGSRWLGLGVGQAVNNINTVIAPALIGAEVTDQREVDDKMLKLDGTPNKDSLGANSILAVSIAAVRAGAMDKGIELWKYFQEISDTSNVSLPTPMLNVINGGEHADNSIDFQEFMLFPLGAPTFEEALRWSSETFHTLKKILKDKKLSNSVGDEGGFAPDLKNNTQALDLIVEAIKAAGYEPGKDIYIAIDPAASEFYDAKTKIYNLKGEGRKLTSKQLVDYYVEIVTKYPVVSIEDGCAEGDWDGFKDLTDRLGDSVQIVGDDLFVTNTKILQEGIDKKIANSILIKFNQIGTISETIDAIKLAQRNGYTAIVSHRSGESEDTTIADLVVGLNTKQIKTGSMSRSERICKYNQLTRISEEVPTFNGLKSLNVTPKEIITPKETK